MLNAPTALLQEGVSLNTMDGQWVLTDVGGVLELTDDDEWPLHFRERWAARLGLPADEYERRLQQADLPDVTTRSGVIDEYWHRVAAALHLSSAERAAMSADFWDAYCGTANLPLLEALRDLPTEIGLAILSNSADGAREEEERRFGFAALFDPICYSHEIGMNKPDPRSFRIALERMHAQPDQVLFIDDRPDNVLAARREGLRAHLHVRTTDTVAILRSFCGAAKKEADLPAAASRARRADSPPER